MTVKWPGRKPPPSSDEFSAVELTVVDDPEQAAAAAAALLVEVAVEGGSIVVAGGSTPRRTYELAAAAHPYWGDVDLWFGDERCVPADDPRSNLQLVREAFLEHLVVWPKVRPVPTDLPAAEAAEAYDAALQGVRLDLVLLGLGSDGHTASLFPDAPALDSVDRLAIEADAGLQPFVERVTLTIPALSAGTHVVFLAVGEEKAEAARRAFGEKASHATPASLVRSKLGTTTVILDRAAASLLRPSDS
jgi:6-phosphogluconolactonase